MILDSVLAVTAAAADATLLSLSEIKDAVGVSDNTHDAALTTLNDRIAARIARACRVAAGGTAVPTLRQETLSETIRLRLRPTNTADFYLRPEELPLARRPIVSVASVTEEGVALDAAAPDYEILPAAGMLRRLSSDEPSRWALGKIVVAYVAGWDTVPDDLKLAAGKLAKLYWAEQTRDQGLRSLEIPGVQTKQFWVGAASDPDVPADIMEMLGPYRNVLVG